MTEGVPSSSCDRFSSHPSLGSRSARSDAAAMEDGRTQLADGQQEDDARSRRCKQRPVVEIEMISATTFFPPLFLSSCFHPTFNGLVIFLVR